MKFTGDAMEADVLRATLHVAYAACKSERQKALAATMQALAPLGPAPSTAATAGTTAMTPTKVPQTLPTGVWATAVTKYNKVQTGGVDRSFPCNLLIGAEKVLARVRHEISISKLFTPILLGEIMTTRAYTSTGQINMMSQKKSDKQELTLEDGQWVTQDPKPWDPFDLLAVLDGLESIRWAWILFDMGNESDVNEYMDWFVRMCKDRKDRIFQVKGLWLAASWRLATDMRQQQTFHNASQALRADTEWVQDRLNQSRKGPKGKPKGDDTRRQTSRGRGTSKGRGRGRGTSAPPPTAWTRPDRTQTIGRTCDGFNRGQCRFGESCRDQHKCSTCGRDNHGANTCFQGKGKGGKGGKTGKDRSRSSRGKGDNWNNSAAQPGNQQ